MRHYPIFRSTTFYTEKLNEWEKYLTCRELLDAIKQRWNNLCNQQKLPLIYHPEKQQTIKKKSKKKKKRKKKGKKQILIRLKQQVQPDQKLIRYWNDLQGKKINRIKEQHLNWSDWRKNRSYKRFLPCHIRKPNFKVLRGVIPMPLATIPISLADVREIRKQDKLAKILARKLAKERRAEARLAKKLLKEKERKKGR